MQAIMEWSPLACYKWVTLGTTGGAWQNAGAEWACTLIHVFLDKDRDLE